MYHGLSVKETVILLPLKSFGVFINIILSPYFIKDLYIFLWKNRMTRDTFELFFYFYRITFHFKENWYFLRLEKKHVLKLTVILFWIIRYHMIYKCSTKMRISDDFRVKTNWCTNNLFNTLDKDKTFLWRSVPLCWYLHVFQKCFMLVTNSEKNSRGEKNKKVKIIYIF